MARPPRSTVDYFPHLIGDGKKMFFIEQKYGNDGYATWFKILELLASTENHYLNLNNETDIMFTAAKCRVSEETLLSIITDLSKFGVIDAELWDSKVLWCQIFIDSIQDAYSKRSNNCMSLEGLRGHLIGLGVLKSPVKPQSKAKETILEDTKEEKVVFPFDSKEFHSMWDHWKTYKKQDHKFSYKSSVSEQAALNELSKFSNGDESIALQIINQSIAKGWKGFFELKNESNGKGKQNGFVQTAAAWGRANDPNWENR